MANIVFPGTFSPPTLGHLSILRDAAASFPNVIVICSTNDAKRPMFTQEQAATLWRTYPLPDNVVITTFADAHAYLTKNETPIMIRGLRGPKDFTHEIAVVERNFCEFGITRYHWIIARADNKDISSTAARRAAAVPDLKALGKMVSPLVASVLLERTLKLSSLHLVVGRPAAGKSTILRETAGRDPRCVHVDTDRFLDDTKDMLRKRFGCEDLARLAIERPDELKDVVGGIWMRRVIHALRTLPEGAHALIEVPYGLQPGMDMYRVLGGKVIYVGCRNEAEHERRILERGTPEHLPFVQRIPGWNESRRIALTRGLRIARITTDRPVNESVHALLSYLKRKSP